MIDVKDLTSVQVLKADKARMDALKMHVRQPTREIVKQAIDALERERAARSDRRKSA